MILKNTIKAISLSSQNANVFDGTYKILNSGLTNACFYLRIMNATDRNITVSYDGTNDNDYVLANSTLNLPTTADSILFSKGLNVYIKGTAGGSGSVYLSGYYQD